MPVNFVPDPSIKKQIVVSRDWAEELLRITDDAAEAAKMAWDAAGPHPYETGDYRGAIEPWVGLEGGRFIGRVNAHDFKSWWIEVGTLGDTPTPAFAPLRLGADLAGLNLEAKHG